MEGPLVEAQYHCLSVPDYNDVVPQQPTYTDHYPWQPDWAVDHTQYMYEDPVSHFTSLFGVSSCENDHLQELKQSSWAMPTPPSDVMDKCIEDVGKVPTDEWQKKCVQSWTIFDIMNWLIHELKSRGQSYENACLKSFRMNGETLCSMTKPEFEQLDPNFGAMLYEALQKYKNMSPPYAFTSGLPSIENIRRDVFSDPEPAFPYVEIPNKQYGIICSDAESDSSQIGQDHKPKRKPGRSPPSRGIRRKQEKKTGRLWEFIRDLLKNRDYCPSLICWENYEEGVFRFVRSDKVAELWGTIKENPRMTYEKLSRAMRYYYKSQVLLPVLGRRLVYKFGPTATDWQTPNPNFRLPE